LPGPSPIGAPEGGQSGRPSAPESPSPASLLASLLESARMTESPLVKRLLWSGLVAGVGALASLATTRVSVLIWKRVFGEDPPE
jgi:hypothetical protein